MKSSDEVYSIKDVVEKDLLKQKGVTGVDISTKQGIDGTDELVIVVYVEDKKDALEKGTLPQEVQGVPIDIIERRFVLHSR